MKKLIKLLKENWDLLDWIVAIVGLIGIFTVCCYIHSCNAQTTQDTIQSHVHPFNWDLYEEGYMPLDFESIYYIDTFNMLIYYDNFDQFDMDKEYELNPNNINEDDALVIHINRGNMIELFNRILQYMDPRLDSDDKIYIQSMFGIGQNDDNEYYISYLGNQYKGLLVQGQLKDQTAPFNYVGQEWVLRTK